jgi:Uncharacterized protein conserved in bacteria
MTAHPTATREEWLAARLELLAEEKALTRRSDELARQRQALPWVLVDKDYRFDTEQGPASLATRSPAVRNCWSTTSCSARITAPAARPARTSPMGSTATSATWRTTT